MNLYLLQYNNYYNRIFKKLDTAAEYIPYLCAGVIAKNPVPNVNFISNDGVVTEQIINWDGDSPDYVIVVNENGGINSRWFVVESVRTRSGQFKLSLYRDLFADYWENITSAPMFVEKGYVSVEDTAIFNDEQITVNKIKHEETLLKDDTKNAWIVGYMAVPTEKRVSYEEENGEVKEIVETAGQISVEYGLANPHYDFYAPTLEDWAGNAYVGTNKKMTLMTDYLLTLALGTPASTNVDTYFFNFKQNSFINSSVGSGQNTGYTVGPGTSSYGFSEKVIKESIAQNTPAGFETAAANYFGYSLNAELYQTLKNYNNLVIKVGASSPKYYRITTHYTEAADLGESKNVTIGSTLGNLYKQTVQNINAYSEANYEDINGNPARAIGGAEYSGNYRIKTKINTIYLTLEQISQTQGLSFTIPATRKILEDAPYCMFCIPYGNEDYAVVHGDGVFLASQDSALSIAAGIAKSAGSWLYDIQLLPYVPDNFIRSQKQTMRLADTTLTEGVDYTMISSADQIIYWCSSSQGTFDISYQYLDIYSDNVWYKTWMLTTTLRLCSPNYNGVFEFNPYKNRGVHYINVDYSYKPFQPYIHLNPDFGGLYGRDFDDARGLVCGGDFSLPVISDAWENYQIQNKNFEEIFRRGITNMEVQQKYAKELEKYGAIAGTVQGGVSGAATGMYMGGGVYGAIAGGIVGAGASLAGGIGDIRINQALRDEAKDYTKDLFALNLQNIMAMPDTLAKVSALNANNKIFPFVEVYRASEPEIDAVFAKLSYNGMTIGRIGKLEDYIDQKPLYARVSYFKGQIIRLENIGDDSHIANAIAAEMNKGVYL